MTKELEALEKVYYGSQGYGDCDFVYFSLKYYKTLFWLKKDKSESLCG